MKIFVCSDVHGNVRALDAVLAVYRSQGPCRFLFLGDAVGYGAHPDACLDRLLNLPRATYLLGNHEWALLDPENRGWFSEMAAESLAWTERCLGGRYDASLRRLLRPTAAERDFTAAHASPCEPLEWPYIYSEFAAAEIFERLDFEVCFLGHTHIPLVYTCNSGPIGLEPGTPFRLDPSDRYIVNAGSVGQPRDGDPRACCCLYDAAEGTMTLHRSAYDAAAEAADILAAGLPAPLAERLSAGW